VFDPNVVLETLYKDACHEVGKTVLLTRNDGADWLLRSTFFGLIKTQVTFDKSNDWEGGRCFGFLTQNATTEGETVFKAKVPPEQRCDSAALTGSEW
jgi:hypothetical protein